MLLINEMKNSFATIFDIENTEKKLSINFLVKNSNLTNYYAREFESIKKKATLTNINMGNIGYLVFDFSSRTETNGYNFYSHYITQKNLFEIEEDYSKFLGFIEKDPQDFSNNITTKYKRKVLFIQGNLDKSLFFVPTNIEEGDDESEDPRETIGFNIFSIDNSEKKELLITIAYKDFYLLFELIKEARRNFMTLSASLNTQLFLASVTEIKTAQATNTQTKTKAPTKKRSMFLEEEEEEEGFTSVTHKKNKAKEEDELPAWGSSKEESEPEQKTTSKKKFSNDDEETHTKQKPTSKKRFSEEAIEETEL